MSGPQYRFLKCWGDDAHGQVSVPSDAMDDVSMVEVGEEHNCVVGHKVGVRNAERVG